MRRIAIFLLLALAAMPARVFAQGEEAPEEMQGNVKVGDKAIGFTLKDQQGQDRSLDSLLKPDGFVALVFYRSADW